MKFIVLIILTFNLCLLAEQIIVEIPTSAEVIDKLNTEHKVGISESTSLLAFHYYLGELVDKDKEKAYEFAKKAYNNNNILGTLLCALFARRGHIHDKNSQLAEECFHKVSEDEADDGASLFARSYLYQYGVGGVEKNYKQYLKLLKEAADKDNIFAAFKYAYIISRKENYINHQEAFKYNMKAAKQGHRIAQNELALAYYYATYGENSEPDYEKCRHWLRISAKNNFELAQINLENLPKLNGL